ncbi:hypothetical protein [Cystobacter fuscus]|uniref:hypothetical protein n=1 Tax=Cystobacter fuscus TaxID=43 RepID=UPI001FDEC451|nr:hypothetical protein [Cystobacter fuscus]
MSVRHAQRRVARDVLERERLVEVLVEPAQQRLERRAIRGGRRVQDELRLSSVALERHHREPGRIRRHRGAVVEPHHVQTEIEPRRGARRRQGV